MWLSRAYFRIKGAERCDTSWGCIMEATAFYTTHVDITFIHEWFDEERECFTAGPKRRITSNVRPQGFHELDTTSNNVNLGAIGL